MIRKNWALPALAFPIVVLLIWTAVLQYLSLTAPRVMVTVEGYDPRSLISGHYLELQPDWTRTDCNTFGGQTCPKDKFEKVYRFYLPEDVAPQLERMINRTRPLMQLEFALADGKPLVRELRIDKRHWSDWYREQMKNVKE